MSKELILWQTIVRGLLMVVTAIQRHINDLKKQDKDEDKE